MQRTIVTCLTAALLSLVVAGHLIGASSAVSYQGRLTTSTGTPVADGSYAVTFSIWTDSVSGSMIWSESQNIQVSGGLFSTTLGNLQPLGGELVLHGNEDLYLQTSLAGAALSPRMAVSTVPRAVIASNLHSVVPGAGSLQMNVGSDTTKITASHVASSLTLDSYLHLVDDRALLGLRCYGAGQPHAKSTCNSEVGDDRAINFLDYDDDADGIPEQQISSSLSPTSAKHAINTKGTGAQGGRSASIEATTDLDSATTTLSFSEDGTSGSSVQISAKKGKRSEAELNLNAINKAADAEFFVDTSRSGLDVNFDSDNDGTTDQSATLSVTPTSTKHAINTKGTGAQGGRSVSVSSSTDIDSASLDLSIDDDGDGIAETKVKLASGASLLGGAIPGGAVLSARYDSDDDGFPEQEISSSIVPTRSQHAINTKGTGAQGGLVLSAKTITDIDSAMTEVSGQDGNALGSVRLTAQPAGATTVSLATVYPSSGTPIIKGSALMTTSGASVAHKLDWDADGDGFSDRRITEDCDDDDAGISIQAGVAIPKFIDITAKAQSSAQQADCGMVMGTGSDTAIHVGCDDISSRIHVVPPSAGTYVFDLVVTDATGLMSMTNSLGAISMQMDGDGRMGIGGAAHATDPIYHSPSGAHLTPGGVWTNASDANLKENFQQVDGAELLEKINDLPISQWNYKSESDEVTHIGPTAQDFQKAFGVGENDKSISTIDPSGIALAAIKELNKKLERENKALRAEMDELKQLVQKLAAQK